MGLWVPLCPLCYFFLEHKEHEETQRAQRIVKVMPGTSECKFALNMKLEHWAFAVVLLSTISSECTYGQPQSIPGSPIQISRDGKLTYTADGNGDRVPDFSYCGYMTSELPIPDVAVKVIVPAVIGDATEKFNPPLITCLRYR